VRRVRPLLLACLAVLAVPAPAGAHDHPVAAEAAALHGDTPQEVRLDLAAAVEAGEPQDAAALSYLPTTWCGTAPSAADDTANAAYPATLPQFRLVYAHPSDRPNRFAQWRDHLQANVSLIDRFVAQQSGERKAPRFDLGTSCGPGYADIAVVALPGTRSFYAGNTSAVRSAVLSALGSADGMRTPVIMADQLSNGGLWGIGSLYVHDIPGPTNAHNHNATSSIIWVPDGETPPASSADGYWPAGFLHEMTHNMGGVQWTAPHNSNPNVSGAFHCWDGRDLMCYTDSANMPVPYTTTVCSALSGAIDEIYDCGGDDYFNPEPAPGSYLATHWNVFDSVFLGDCATLGDACGRETGAPSAAAGPSVSGSGRVGVALTGSAGTWTGTPSPTLALQWQRSAGAGWEDISGAGDTSYTPVVGDVARYVRLKVTATNTAGTASATSAPVLITERFPPVNVSAPWIGGTARTGAPLTGELGWWNGRTPMGFSYQWQRDGASGWTANAGAVFAQYVPGPVDVGSRLRLRVTATNEDGSAVAYSVPTAVVPEPAAPPADPVPPAQTWPAPLGTVLPGPVERPASTPVVERVRTLRLRRGRRVVARLRVRVVAGSRAGLDAVRLRAPSGRYRLRVCGVRCATLTPAAKRGVLRLPPVAVDVRGATSVRVTLRGPRWSAAGSVAA
jgi:hypothetical protein